MTAVVVLELIVDEVPKVESAGVGHLVCITCHPVARAGNVALCGWVCSLGEPGSEGDDLCVVCIDLDELPCQRCGSW